MACADCNMARASPSSGLSATFSRFDGEKGTDALTAFLPTPFLGEGTEVVPSPRPFDKLRTGRGLV